MQDFVTLLASNLIFQSKNTKHHPQNDLILTSPSPLSPSQYNTSWEPYIASNFHFYTVPLAIFLHRCLQFDFSSSSSSFSTSLNTLQKVLRVYSPSLLNTLDRVASSNQPAKLSSMKLQHEQNLGRYCPPPPPTDDPQTLFGSFQSDVQILLQRVFTQCYQKQEKQYNIDTGFFLVDDFINKILAFFAIRSPYDEYALYHLYIQFRTLVNLPADYYDAVLLPIKAQIRTGVTATATSVVATTATSATSLQPERKGVLLTSKGREQILQGTHKFNPYDVVYLGDPMFAPPQTYEIPVLVNVCNSASTYLNDKLGLVAPITAYNGELDMGDDPSKKQYLEKIRETEQYQRIWFRMNLRFLADYRNLLTLLVVVFLWRLVF